MAPPSDPTGATALERAQQVEAEEVARLYSQGIASQAVALLNVGLVTIVFWSVAPHAALLAWVALMIVVAAARVFLTLLYRRATPSPASTSRWRLRFTLGTFASGLAWGTGGITLFPVVPLVYQVFFTYVLGGMAVGAAAVMSPVLVAYWAFLGPMTLPIMVQFFLYGDTMRVAMGVMFAVCTLMFVSSARQMHASLLDSIRLRFENLDLVRDLSVANQEAARANQSLQAEIGERTRAEERLTASLGEKEVLLTEIHHRVKNNLQVISSLLSLQSRSLTNPEALSVFAESQNRVRSMALVHEKLYQSSDLARIDFTAYIRELASYLCRVYHNTAETIPLRIHARDVFLTIERAVPCGLIVTELLSNALKYAFPAGRQGEVAVEMVPGDDGRYSLTIRDNGIGLPAEIDFRHANSLGLRIVKTLTEQLGGTITLSNNAGAAFTLTFPIVEDDGASA